MVLRPEPVAAALEALRRPDSTVILPDPGGEVFTQARAHDLAARAHLIILCPRYEGVDERIRSMVDLELSIGDYVLSGGEIPGAGRGRRDPAPAPRRHRRRVHGRGVVHRRAAGIPAVHAPAGLRGMAVPDVLTSGHHEAVRKWRLKESLRRTARRRPELLADRPMSKEEARLLAELRDEASADSPRPRRRRPAVEVARAGRRS